MPKNLAVESQHLSWKKFTRKETKNEWLASEVERKFKCLWVPRSYVKELSQDK